jgi:hypothetical protein
MVERTPEDVAAGVLRFTFGGEERTCPTLKLRASREWIRAGVARLPELQAILGGDQTPDNLAALIGLGYDAALEQILEYDRTGSLGGRDWLEEHADPTELFDALRLMGHVALPFVGDLRGLLAILPGLLDGASEEPADESASTSSTSGPSPSGDSTPTPSSNDSTPPS